ncbi:acyltransferase [Leucobacter weissii]|uniref:Acyltransferase n=1 Tax=Leucobacter weissii TaxID=1983706 RepID=A0A939MM20_9MICO|nr:acyltransferase family protein [Leucobacter weissii]MBO1903046.1 acyltransferase [Leucobacter weissii]
MRHATLPTSAERRAAGERRFNGLDGMRAIAVSLVVVYHLFPDALPGGFLGVDVFFVISGFLIASLLLRERRRSGRIDLLAFWRRRARRLLPALALVLLICTALALAISGGGDADLLVGIGAQLLGSAFFVSNWVFVSLGGDYFTRDDPELFRNTWSLSIEEQFYLVLPLVLLLVLRVRSRETRALIFSVLAAASAALMAGYAFAGADPTRVYFGSDSHVFGLFAGVALATALNPREDAQGPPPGHGIPAQLGFSLAALLGLAVLGWLAWTLEEASRESFLWGFQLATAAALLVIWAITRRGSWIGRLLDAAPLRWIGNRSYGIYLWHWPLLLLASEALGSAPAPWHLLVAPVALTLTVGLASWSHRFVEQPVRRLGLRRALHSIVLPSANGAVHRTTAVAVTGVLLVTVPATAVAVATAPALSSSAAAIARGAAAEQEQEQEAAAEGRGIDGAIDAVDGRIDADADPPVAGPSPEGPKPKRIRGKNVFAVGDSVMLASLPELREEFPGIRVDAAVSRGLAVGVGIVRGLAEKKHLRQVIVVGLGTNGPIERSDLNELRRAADTRSIVLVNAHGDRPWIPEVNRTLASFAEARRGVVLADWDAAAATDPEALAGDGIHPNTSGGRIYAKTVRTALKELQAPAERIGHPSGAE